MRRLIIIALVSLIGLPVFAAPTVSELEGVVGEWVKLKREGLEEKQRWEEERSGYERELALIDSQKRNLTQRLETLRTALADQKAPQERADRMKELSAQLQRVDAEVKEASDALEVLRKKVPKPLVGSLPQSVPTTGNVSTKLQRLLALHAAFSDLHNRIHITHEMLPVGDGKTQLFDVIYLGMARGFAVAADDSLALEGIPGEEGWQWKARPEWTAAIRGLQQTQSGELPPGYISLDVKP